jgi:hypothetical protein
MKPEFSITTGMMVFALITFASTGVAQTGTPRKQKVPNKVPPAPQLSKPALFGTISLAGTDRFKGR